MRISSIAGILIFLLSMNPIVLQSASFSDPHDDLFNSTDLDSYHRVVKERLLPPTKHGKCQALFVPSFIEESAVYIQYDNHHKEAPPKVVTLKFETSLWSGMWPGADEFKNLSVGEEIQPIRPSEVDFKTIRLP